MSDAINTMITDALEDLKGRDIVHIDVREQSQVTDTLVIASGTSTQHVRSLARHTVEEAKKRDMQPLGVEGLEFGDWVLVDFGDTVLHVMLPETRQFYDLEKLWTLVPEGRHTT